MRRTTMSLLTVSPGVYAPATFVSLALLWVGGKVYSDWRAPIVGVIP